MASASPPRGGQATLAFWDPATGKEIGGFDGHQHAVHSGMFAPDGKTLATVSDEPFVRMWDLKTGKARALAAGSSNVRYAAFAPDGRTLAVSGSHGRPGLWEVSSGKPLRTLQPRNNSVGGGAVFFSGDGKTLASSTGSCEIHFWDAETGREGPVIFWGIQDGTGPLFDFPSFILAPNGKTVATTRSQFPPSGVILWDAATGKERLKLAEAGVPAGFSPDGRLVAILHGKQMDLVATATGQRVGRMEVDSIRAGCAAFAPDGRTVATAGDARAVYLWETVTGKQRERLFGHEDGIKFVAFSPDGLRLASGGQDHTALIWDLGGGAAKHSLAARECDALWAALGGDDAGAAYRAVQALAGAPGQAPSFLKNRLKPVAPVDPKQFASLLKELDSEKFQVRERASADLEAHGHGAWPLLRKALSDEGRSAEVRRRLQELVDKLDGFQLSPRELQAVRGIEVLERIGGQDASRILKNLALGVAGARVTREAKASLERLSSRAENR